MASYVKPLVALILLFLFSAGAVAQDIKIATYRALAFFPAWFAKDAGYFEREGLNAELLFFASGNEMTAAMLSKSVDFSTTSADRPMILRERGQNSLNLIALTVRSPFSILVPTSSALPYGDVAALKGKKIGITQRGSSSDLAIRAILSPHNIDADKDVTLLALGSAETAIAALGSAQVDAMIVSEPSTSIAISQQNIAKMFLDLRKGEGSKAAGLGAFFSLQATEDYVKGNPETVRKAMRAICKGIEAAKADPQAALAVAQKYFRQMDATALKVALESETQTFGTVITGDMIKSVADIAVGAHFVKKSYNLDDVVIGKEFRPLWSCN
jgi:NitT/TauT family transport system substrate-binding protein